MRIVLRIKRGQSLLVFADHPKSFNNNQLMRHNHTEKANIRDLFLCFHDSLYLPLLSSIEDYVYDRSGCEMICALSSVEGSEPII